MPRRPLQSAWRKPENSSRPPSRPISNSIGARPSHFYDLELDTPAGLLRLTVYDDWVAGRFDDVALGKAFTAYMVGPAIPSRANGTSITTTAPSNP